MISVIIPVYNTAAYLPRCLDSVCNQTLKDLEIICVDDASTDGSAAILAEYAAKDPRLRVITQKNAGAVVESVRCGLGIDNLMGRLELDVVRANAFRKIHKVA